MRTSTIRAQIVKQIRKLTVKNNDNFVFEQIQLEDGRIRYHFSWGGEPTTKSEEQRDKSEELQYDDFGYPLYDGR